MPSPFRIALLFLALLPALHGIAALWPPMNHDAAAILHWAQRLLRGETLYRDMTDVNPPLIFWISAIPAAFARLTGLPAAAVYNGFFALIATAGVAGFTRLIPASPFRGPLLAAAILTAFALPQHSFGQREHLLFLTCLPYLAARAGSWEGVRLPWKRALAVALPAAIGICVKPHFLAVPILIEGALLIRRGPRVTLRDAAPSIMIAVGIFYLAAVWFFARLYLTDVVPTGLSYYASSSETGWGAILVAPEALLVLVPLLILLPLLRWAGGVAAVAWLFALATTLAGLSQGKGWDYHFLAAREGLVIAGSAVVLALLSHRLKPLVIFACALIGTLWFIPGKSQMAFKGSPSGDITHFLAEQASGQPVLWLGTGITPQFPAVVQARARSITWPMSLWLLAEIYDVTRGAAHTPDAMPPAERDLWRHTVEALVQKKPRLIVITEPTAENGFDDRDFDWLAWLGQDKEGAAALANYRPIDAPDGLEALIRID
jgi:hypothetical protein